MNSFATSKLLPWLLLFSFLTLLSGCNSAKQASSISNNPIIQISAGDSHSLALRKDGSVWSWGRDACAKSITPLQVKGLSEVTAVAGGYFNYALKKDGTVWIWGESPLPIKGLNDVTAIAAGGNYLLALKKDGSVWSWERSFTGCQFKEADLETAPARRVENLNEIKSIARAESSSMALKSDGSVWTWVDKELAERAQKDKTQKISSTPSQVTGLADVIAISEGNNEYDAPDFVPNHLALKKDGTVWAWGGGPYGDEDIPTKGPLETPVQVFYLSEITAIAAGNHLSLALGKDGSVWAWGFYSHLGKGHYKGLPALVGGLGQVRALALSGQFALALKKDGSLWAWGDNREGELGSGVEVPNPVQVTGMNDAAAISFGIDSVLVLKKNGTVWESKRGNFNAMVPVEYFDKVQAIAGAKFSQRELYLRKDGTVWVKGRYFPEEIGKELSAGERESEYLEAPLQIKGVSDVIAIASGDSDSLVLKRDGSVWAWGENEERVYGQNQKEFSKVPVQKEGLSEIVAIAEESRGHSLALKQDGSVWEWSRDMLGSGKSSEIPIQVKGLSDVIAIAPGNYHALALKKDGSVWAWGYDKRKLGIGQVEGGFIETPAQVKNLTEVAAIFAGDLVSFALKKDGSFWAWGEMDSAGLQGLAPVDAWGLAQVPVQVKAFSDVVAILPEAVGPNLALKKDGSLWTWGYEKEENVGIVVSSDVPIQVKGLP